MPGVLAFKVHRPHQAHHARSLLARGVGDARPAIRIDVEPVDQLEVGLLDRLDHFTGARFDPRRVQWFGELPVGVSATGAPDSISR
jgi:hypothetical protein